MSKPLGASWQLAIWRLIAILASGLIIGFASGQILWALVVTLVGLGLWHGVHLWRLARWLEFSRSVHPPKGYGLWAEIFSRVQRLRQRSPAARRRLATILREFRTASAALPYGMLMLNEQDQIRWCNRAACEFLGLRIPQDRDANVRHLIGSAGFAQWLSAAAPGERLELVAPVDSHIKLSLQLIPYDDDSRMILVRDVTQLARLEQVRQDFVANVSHELRTPLTVIAGYIEILEDEAPEEIREVLGEVSEQTRRMRNIVEDLLTISRLDAGLKPKKTSTTVDMRDLLRVIESDAASLSEGRHKLIFQAPRAGNIKGNPKALRSAFSNLVVNAVHYTPVGGSITVSWDSMADGSAEFSVLDTGCGISQHHIERLTERFYRVSGDRARESGGTGLGLAIVKNVVEQHEGVLKIESRIGEGSCFRCQFPVSRLVATNPITPKSEPPGAIH